MSQLLCCHDLTKTFGSTVALNHINLVIESGKIIGLLGPNGSGKTTLIKLINGLLKPNTGTLTINGLEPCAQTKEWVAYLPDNSFLNSWMTVKQIVEYFTDFYADFRPDMAYELLQKLGISPKQKLKALSKGNKEKVCLILTMSREARLYVLDEPIAGVDPAARDYVINTILTCYSPESSVIISTHLIADIEPILNEAILIHQGNILMHKSVEEIREESGKSVDELFREVFRW